MAGHHLAYLDPGNGEIGRTCAYYETCAIDSKESVNQKILTQVYARHTGEQAEWVTDMVVQQGIEAIALMAVPGHLFPRAFCTQLKSFIKRGVQIPIIPVSHAINPFEELMMTSCQDYSLDYSISQVDFHTSEFQKIISYTDDVASLDEVQKYCLWLVNHEIFK